MQFIKTIFFVLFLFWESYEMRSVVKMQKPVLHTVQLITTVL
jgi:hypothetical protein